jgi:hypothetical protein
VGFEDVAEVNASREISNDDFSHDKKAALKTNRRKNKAVTVQF